MATTKKVALTKAVAKKAVVRKAAALVEVRNDRVDWRSLYLYAVCLITLLVVLFATVSLVNSIINVAFPEPIYVDIYAKPENLPSALLQKQQEAATQLRAIKSIFTALTTIAIALPLYLYHWRQTKK